MVLMKRARGAVVMTTTSGCPATRLKVMAPIVWPTITLTADR